MIHKILLLHFFLCRSYFPKTYTEFKEKICMLCYKTKLKWKTLKFIENVHYKYQYGGIAVPPRS